MIDQTTRGAHAPPAISLRKNFFTTTMQYACFAAVLCFSTAAHAATANWNSSTGTLTVTITSGAGETVEIGYGVGDGSAYWLAITGVTNGFYWGQNEGVHTDDVKEIVVNGGSGDDIIEVDQISTSLTYWHADLDDNITLNGNAGNDVLRGSELDDDLNGGFGDDVIESNGGYDEIRGGDGVDSWIDYSTTYQVATSIGAVDVTLTSGELEVEAIDLSGNSSLDLEMGASGSNLVAKLSGHTVYTVAKTSVTKRVTIRGSDDDDTIDCEDMDSTTDLSDIYCEGGNDIVIASSDHRCRIFGDSGNDIVTGNGNDDYLIDYNQQSDSDTLLSGAMGLNEEWSWEAGDILKADWDEFVDHTNTPPGFSLNSNGDKIALGSGTLQGYLLATARRLNIQIHNVAPKMLTSGVLETYVHHSGALNDHGQFNPWVNDSSIMTQKRYCTPNKRYRFEFDAEFASSTDWNGGDWVQALQVFQDVFPSGWTGKQETPIGLYVQGKGTSADMYFRAWGSTGPSFYNHKNELARFPLVVGNYEFVMEFTLDYTGNDSFTRIEIKKPNGQLVIGETTASNMVNASAASTPGAAIPKFGVYTGSSYSKLPTIRFSKLKMFTE